LVSSNVSCLISDAFVPDGFAQVLYGGFGCLTVVLVFFRIAPLSCGFFGVHLSGFFPRWVLLADFYSVVFFFSVRSAV